MTNFVGEAKPITATEVAQDAAKARIGVAEVRTVMAVESRNSGYDGSRRPLILFEPHVFYRNLSGQQRLDAVHAGIAYPHWGQMRYPPGSEAQYLRLTHAIQINEEAAYRSVSIGMGQILGENYKAAGCDSAKQMFEEAMESEANQLRHMLNFIMNRGLRNALCGHNWVAFARGYNGGGQVEKYASWLEREYKKWSRIAETPRAELTAQDLKDAGSKTIAATDTAKTAVGIAAFAGPSAGVALDIAGQGLGPITRAVRMAKESQENWDWVSDNWQFFLGLLLCVAFMVACYYAWQAIHKVEEERVLNARTGINQRI